MRTRCGVWFCSLDVAYESGQAAPERQRMSNEGRCGGLMRFGSVSWKIVFCLLLLMLGTGCMAAQTAKPAMYWVGSWAASQQVPETQNLLDTEAMRDATLRQIVHLSVGGDRLRVRMSNAFGTAPLHLTAVHVAWPVSAAGGAVDAGSDT